MKVLKIFNENCDVVYSYIKAPLFITDRDFLQKRQLLQNYKGVDFIIAYENFEDPQFPEKKGVIRADSIISGYIIRNKDEQSCYLTIISQNDIKGFIPKSIVNANVAKAPLGWMKKFNKAIKNYKNGLL